MCIKHLVADNKYYFVKRLTVGCISRTITRLKLRIENNIPEMLYN